MGERLVFLIEIRASIEQDRRIERGESRKLFYWVAGLTLVRLLWLACRPLGMVSDETYYWDWGRHPDWGYFSKPPLIGWVNGLIDALSGGSAYAIKASATLLVGAGIWSLAQAAAEVAGYQAGKRTVWIVFATISSLVSAAILTTDAMLLLAWNTALWLFLRCWQRGGTWREYVGIFLAMGFGILAKQMMLIFPVVAIVVMLAVGRGKVSLAKLAGASVGSLLCLIPSLWWNSKHHWITVEHTEHHFQAAGHSLKETASRMGEFFGLQAGLLTPLLFLFLIGCLIQTLRAWRMDRGRLALAMFSAPGLAMCTAMALYQQMNANWPIVFWSGALALAAAVPAFSWRKWSGIAVGSGIAIVGSLMLYSAVARKVPFVKPEQRLWHGWATAAEKIAKRANLTENGPQPLIIVTGHRFAGSQLAFNLPGQPRLYYFDGDPAITSQYDFWQPTAEQLQQPVLIISYRTKPTPKPLPDELQTELEGLKEIEGVVEVPLGKSDSYYFKMYTADKLRHWPG